MSDDTDDMPDDLKGFFWAAFIRWAWLDEKARADFTRETGVRLLPAKRSGIEALVDEVTGARDDLMWQFVKWATIEIYGLDGAPQAYRDELAKRDAAVQP